VISLVKIVSDPAQYIGAGQKWSENCRCRQLAKKNVGDQLRLTLVCLLCPPFRIRLFTHSHGSRLEVPIEIAVLSKEKGVRMDLLFQFHITGVRAQGIGPKVNLDHIRDDLALAKNPFCG
jgi:hypothetical protein